MGELSGVYTCMGPEAENLNIHILQWQLRTVSCCALGLVPELCVHHVMRMTVVGLVLVSRKLADAGKKRVLSCFVVSEVFLCHLKTKRYQHKKPDVHNNITSDMQGII